MSTDRLPNHPSPEAGGDFRWNPRNPLLKRRESSVSSDSDLVPLAARVRELGLGCSLATNLTQIYIKTQVVLSFGTPILRLSERMNSPSTAALIRELCLTEHPEGGVCGHSFRANVYSLIPFRLLCTDQ